MILDIRTIFLVYFSIFLILGILLLFAEKYSDVNRGLRNWAFSNFFLSIGFSFVLLKNLHNDLSFVMGLTFIDIGFLCHIGGIREFFELRRLTKIFWGISVIFLLNSILSIIILKSPPYRVGSNSLMLFIISLTCVLTIHKSVKQNYNTIARSLQSMFLAYCLLFSLRFISAFIIDSEFRVLSNGLINQLAFMLGGLIQISISVAYIVLVNHTISEKLRITAITDPLTGILNRGELDRISENLCQICTTENRILSFCLIDVDHFKSINDRYGHQIGDEVLKKVASVLNEKIPKEAKLGRYGGEEFCILFPDKDLSKACIIVEEIRSYFDENPFQIGNKSIPIKLSLGVTDSSLAGYSVDQLIRRSDFALISAKNSGRNRVVPDREGITFPSE